MAAFVDWWKQVLVYMSQGGFVMWPLAISAGLLWYALGYRFFLLQRGRRGHLRPLFQRALEGMPARGWGVLDRAMAVGVQVHHRAREAALSAQNTFTPQAFRKQLDEAFGTIESSLGQGSLVVKLVVVIAPLAGLLGTVSGMIETFDALGDMTLFRQSGGIAGGISQALISTQMGLAVAIPGLLVGQMLQRREEKLREEIWQLKEILCSHHGITYLPERTGETSHSEASSPEPTRDKSMRFGRKKRSSDAQVDISPLIDMVFILLIFFMVSTTFVKDLKIELERPAASSATRASTKALRVHIDRAGAIYLDGSQVKSWMLQSRVRQVLKDDPSKPVLVITDRLVQAEKLIEVVDQCRLAGAKDVGVATRKET